MRSVNVALPDDLADRLVTLAARERRSPRDQAAVVLIDALRRIVVEPDVEPRSSRARESDLTSEL